MRRNVRNITLMGIAALVLGGVAVAASGTFDSPPTDALVSDSSTVPTTSGRGGGRGKARQQGECRGWGNRDCGGRAGAGTGRRRRDTGTGDADGRAEDREDRGSDGLHRQGQVRGSVRRGIAHRDGERWLRRQLVHLDERVPGQPHPARRHERRDELGQSGSGRSAPPIPPCQQRSSTPRVLRFQVSVTSRTSRSTAKMCRASSSTSALASPA